MKNDVYYVVNERIKKFAEVMNLSQNRIARETGIPQSSVNRYYADRIMSTEFLVDFFHAFPQVSAEWVFRGNGDMTFPIDGQDNVVIQSNAKSMAEKIDSLEKEIQRLKQEYDMLKKSNDANLKCIEMLYSTYENKKGEQAVI